MDDDRNLFQVFDAFFEMTKVVVRLGWITLLLNPIWLVVWTPLKNMKVNWDDYSQYMGK